MLIFLVAVKSTVWPASGFFSLSGPVRRGKDAYAHFFLHELRFNEIRMRRRR